MSSIVERNETTRKLYSIEDFDLIIKRERFRSDRNNQKFSLINFDVKNFQNDVRLLDNCIETLISRIRISDEIGWFDDHCIALLLPDTEIQDAQKLVQSVDVKRFNTVSPPPYKFYMYPSLTWIDGNGDNKQSWHQENVYESFAYRQKIPFWKRVMDIFGSLAGLILLSPILILIAIAIKIVSPGPIFFKQKRVGLSGNYFNLLKFRTMRINNDTSEHRLYLKELINEQSGNEKPMEKIEDETSLIKFGKIFRITCLDELPQLVNVLIGDMSLVGPRPCIPYEAEEYLHWHARRFDITPGITGLWQVSGKNKTTFKEMIRLDIKYAAERSFLLDMKILIKTPYTVVSQIFEGIFPIKKVRSSDKEDIIGMVEVA